MAPIIFLKTIKLFISFLISQLFLTQQASVTLLFAYQRCLSSRKVPCIFSDISNFLEVRSENRNNLCTKFNYTCQALLECPSRGVTLSWAGSDGHQTSCLQSTYQWLPPHCTARASQTILPGAEHLLGLSVPVPMDLLSPWPAGLALWEILGQWGHIQKARV